MARRDIARTSEQLIQANRTKAASEETIENLRQGTNDNTAIGGDIAIESVVQQDDRSGPHLLQDATSDEIGVVGCPIRGTVIPHHRSHTGSGRAMRHEGRVVSMRRTKETRTHAQLLSHSSERPIELGVARVEPIPRVVFVGVATHELTV